jgi:PAS domain S-box-containing protein
MTLVTRFRGYGILTLALALFSVSIFFSFDRMLKEQEEIAHTSEDNTIWTATEGEVELYRMLDVLREYSIQDSPVGHDELQQRFEILVSQLQRLHQGVSGAKLHAIPDAEATINDLLAQLQSVEKAIIFLKKGDRPGVLGISDTLRQFAAPLHLLTVGALHQADQTADERRQRLKDVYLQLIFYFVGVSVAGTVLLLLLFRGIRRANRLLRERELTEERLRESEQRFRDYAASSSDWLWETDDRGRFTYFSKGYLEKVGLSAVEILGKTHEEIALTDGDETAWTKQREVMALQQPFRDFKYRMRTEGEIRHIKVSGVPIFDTDGAFQGYRGTGTDLTAQVEAEIEAMRARTLLSEAVESLDEGLAVFDPEDRLVQCNTRFREFYADAADALVPGTSFEEITRAAAYRGVFPDAVGREEAWIAERTAARQDPETPYDFRLKDGRWIQAREIVLANGWRVRTRIDITHQKRREESLRREALIWGQMSDGVIVTDLHGNITNWNPAAERMFGYTAAEAIGRTPHILHGPKNETLLATVLDAVQRDSGWVGEIDFVRKDRSAGIAETVVVPLRDDSGNRIAIIWVNHDITLRKQTEVELVAAKEQAELANQAKSQFLATMSHEIRTPMNGVLGMIGLLLDTRIDEEQRGYAETVRESGEALVTIIDDILDFSKMEAGKLELERMEFDLRQVVEGVVDLLAPRAQSKGVEIGSCLAPQVPTVLKGDPGRLRQILLNLAGNSVKFTEHGGISVLVSPIDTTSARARVKVEIVDTGIGIPEHLHAGLFAEFTQVDPSYTRRYGGTGLGLAISKKLTEMMGGEIGFSSKLGVGSTFWFTVDLERGTQPSAVTARPPGLAPARVLVVDDNRITSGILERQLGAEDLSASSAADSAAALAALTAAARLQQPFNFALIDQQLGTQSGEELARQIKREPLIASTRLALVMPLGSRTDGDAARRLGFDATITKPVRQSTLVNCLARLAGLAPQAPAVEAASDAASLGTLHADGTTSYPGVTAEGAHSSAAAASAAVSDLARMRVLLVEDSRVNQMVAMAMLAKLAAAVDTATNGVEAIEAVRSKHYDFILMDVAMPEMDGLEATRIIRSMPGPKGRLPIIAMTAHAMEGDRQRCLAVGMDDYITKPIDRTKLVQTMARWIDRNRARAPGAPQAGKPDQSWRPTLVRSTVERAAAPPAPQPARVPPRRASGGEIARDGNGPKPAAAEGSDGVRAADGPASAAPGGMREGIRSPVSGWPAVLDSATLVQLEADTNPSVVQELVKTFILETVERLERISRAASVRDIATLEREAHSLKSSSGTFGAQALQERAGEIESACQSGKAEAAVELTTNIRELAASAAHAMVQHFSATG